MKKFQHWICCDEDLALCGADQSQEEITDDDVTCPMCIVLYPFPCRLGCDGADPEDETPFVLQETRIA